MNKSLSNQSNKMSIMQKVVLQLADLSIYYRNLRIKHGVLIFILIWSRILLGFCINLSLVTPYSGPLYKSINWVYLNYFLYFTQPNSFIMNVTVIGFFLVFATATWSCQFSSKPSFKIVGILLSIIHHCISPLLIRYLIGVGINCKSENNNFLIQIGCLLSFVSSFLLDQIFKLTQFSSQSKNENLLICNKNVGIYIQQCSIYVLIIIISSLTVNQGQIQEFLIILNILHLIISLIPLYTVTFQFHYHNEFAQNIFCLGVCFKVSNSIVSLMCTVFNVELMTRNMEILILSVALFLFWGLKQYTNYRNNRIILQLQTSTSKHRHLKIYINILANLLLGSNSNISNFQFILNSMKNQHIQQCHNLDCICQNKQSLQDVKIQMKNFLIKTKVKNLLILNAKNFQMAITCCFFLLTYYGAFPDLLFILNSIKIQGIRVFTLSIEYQCFKTEIKTFLSKKKCLSNAASTQIIQQQDNLIIESAKHLQQISALKKQFWIDLNKKNPDFKKINQLINKQLQQIRRMQDNVQRIYRNFLYSFTMLQLVCIYQICIKLKLTIPNKIKESFRNYCIIKNQLMKMIKNQNFNLQKIMFEKNCVIFQSRIQKQNMGIILNVSRNVTSVFGFARNAIINQNINEVMPKSMQKQHDVILQSWRERASWANIHKVRHIFAMTKDRNCFQSAIFLRILQREESINLLATFVKGNDKDYMIINDDGIIDGIGSNFKYLLGQGVLKLPFSLICPQANYIFSSARKNLSETICVNLYHIKGLQSLIDLYQYSKYQIQNETQNKNLIQQSIQTRQRRVQVTIQIKPYRMGNLFYVILKLEQVHKMQTMTEQNDQNVQTTQKHPVSSYLTGKQLNMNTYDNNSSLHTSNYETELPSQTILFNLQQKFNKPGEFKNKCVIFYCFAIVILCILSILVCIVKYSFQSAINEQVGDHSSQATRFSTKSNCISFINSRIDNIQSNLITDQSQIQYQISRSFAELKRFQYNRQNEHSGLWMTTLSEPAVLQRTMKWNYSSHNQTNLLIDIYYKYYFDQCKHIQQKHTGANKQRIGEDYTHQLVRSNHQNFKQFVNQSSGFLKNNILGDLHMSRIFSSVKTVLISLLMIAIMVVVWKIKYRQIYQNQTINKVFSTISQYNCFQCSEYYKKVWNIISRSIEDGQAAKNVGQRIQRDLVQKSKLKHPYEQLQIQKDKLQKSRVFHTNQAQLRKVKIILCLILSPLLIAVVISCIYENYVIEKQADYFNKYFKFMETQKQIVYDFLAIKQIVYDHANINELPYNFDKRILLSKQQQGLLNRNFVNLVWAVDTLDPSHPQLSQYTDERPICQKIIEQDAQLHNHLCKNNSMFPFNRLKLIQANSITFEYISNVYYSLKNKVENQNERIKRLKIVQQVLTLKLTYIYKFLRTAQEQGNQFRRQKQMAFQNILFLELIAFVLAILGGGYYSNKICESMNKNCGKILVVPEKVLRNTKGAMRYVEEVLNYIMH